MIRVVLFLVSVAIIAPALSGSPTARRRRHHPDGLPHRDLADGGALAVAALILVGILLWGLVRYPALPSRCRCSSVIAAP